MKVITEELVQTEEHDGRPKTYYLALFTPMVLLALGIVLFILTGDLREKQTDKKEKNRYQTVLPEAEAFEEVKTDKKAVDALLAEAGFPDISLKRIIEGKSGNQQSVGKIYELCDASGYAGTLTLLIGMNESGAICGILVKDGPEFVMEIAGGELDSFLEQFLYSRKDKIFWTGERTFGGVEVVKMESAPVTSREIVRMVNGCRLLSDNLNTLLKETENE